MDRVTQLRGAAGGSRDSTLDASSLPSEAYITANDSSSSKFFSLSEDDSTFDLSPLKDVSLASAAAPDKSTTESNDLISNLSPISKNTDLLDAYKIGKQIEAANILSGGVNIFEDNDNSYDGNELVIDDNAVVLDDKGNTGLKEPESELPFLKADNISEGTSVENEAEESKDTEVVLQIDGKNVNAIDIGNGLYLYRKEGEEELAAVQIVDDGQQHPSFKFLKVRENAEGNLEVYEEIEIEVPKEVPTKDGKTAEKNTSHVPLKDINKVISDENCYDVKKKDTTPFVETSALSTNVDVIPETSKVSVSESKLESTLNSRIAKCNETKKSPFIHSTPNKEGIPLTKVMVHQQLHPNRHSDNVKTIEVHTDSIKQKGDSKNKKNKELPETTDTFIEEKEKIKDKCVGSTGNENVKVIENKNEKQKTNESEKICTGDTKLELKNFVKNDISLIDKPLIQKDSGKNEKSTLLETSTNITSKVGTIIIKDGTSKGENTSVKKRSETNEISASENDKISIKRAIIEKDSNANEKEVTSNEITDKDKVIELIDTSKKEEGIKPYGTSTTVKNDGMCDLLKADKESTVVGKSESKIDIISVPTSKQNEEDLKKEEVRKIEQPEFKNLTIENVSVAPEAIKSYKEKLDVNTTGEKQKISGILYKENDDKNMKEIKTNLKYPENKDTCLPDPENKIDISLKNDNRKENHLRIVAADKPSQSPKIPNNQVKKTGEDVKDVVEVQLDSTTTKEFSHETSLSSINNENLTDTISADKKENPKFEKDLVSTENYSKHDAVTVETSTSTSNRQPNKQKQHLKVSSTADSHSAEEPKLEISKDTFLAINPVLSLDKIKQTEVEKTETLTDEPIPAATKIPSIKLNKPWDSKNKETSIKIEESTKKQGSPIKPIVKVDAVTVEKTKVNSPKKCSARIDNVASSSALTSQNMHGIKKEMTKDNTFERKPININNAAVPFGKWTEAHRQEFLNKIKESKVPSSSSNTNQIKQPNDLNRLDVLQKIDSQRQINSAVGKADLVAANKLTVKNETKKFTVKPIVAQNSKVPVKTEALIVNRVSSESRKQPKQEVPPKHLNMPNTTFSVSTSKTDSVTKRTGIYNQDLIDKTIEDIINRAIPGSQQEEKKSIVIKECKKSLKPKDLPYRFSHPIKETQTKSSAINVIEMKMNELHGIPFVERPPDELPKVYSRDLKTYAKQDKMKSPVKTLSKIPNLVPFSSLNQGKVSQEKFTEVDSEEEIIEHEPITGDIELNKVSNMPKPVTNKAAATYAIASANIDVSKKESIITENDFDKFVRRNSITYENCLTVNFEGRDKPNVVHTVKEKDAAVKPLHTERSLTNINHEISPKQLILHQNKHSDKIQLTSTSMPAHDDVHDKNYPSKLQMAYQSAITAKRQNESPITIIEDRPVKVVYMDVPSGFTSNQLNVQGKDISPIKKQITEAEVTTASCDSVDSDMLEIITDKSQDKSKSKHQRKQVLTPVDTPELELIEPSDLVIEHSPKKKRKADDIKFDKSPKNIVPKKSYLLGRGLVDDRDSSWAHDLAKSSMRESVDQNKSVLAHNTTASAIDSLVKAAELLETQAENMNSSTTSVDSDSLKSAPAKRGRGRPRKYPLQDELQDKNKTPTYQNKPRLIDCKKPKDIVSDDGDSSDEGILQENWSMGKINENIVCPICNKLFRSENVVFKHVKHCTGPSPNRSESDKKSPHRISRLSQESDSKSSQESKSDDIEYEPVKTAAKKETTKRKSKELLESNKTEKQEVRVFEGSLVKNLESSDPQHESRKTTIKSKLPSKVTNLACETCGKTFRQLSYLVNHKLQHEKYDPKKSETIQIVDKSVFTCEICKKEFRKLHHMVQHRLIHNPSNIPPRTLRKSSSEQNVAKEQNGSKKADDQSAAFRCEPCDKSFRKLHHLVEHRETHDGINRQKGSSNASIAIEKSPPPPPQCDICKKTFRKLHHLIEHKEQHQETSSEKSDDRSVKSVLSTKDIIHECSLCYMVFPNEHSLNKHSVICQRKKRQSAAKQKAAEKSVEDSTLSQKVGDIPEANKIIPMQKPPVEKSDDEFVTPTENNDLEKAENDGPKTVEKIDDLKKVTKTLKQNRIADKRVSKENDGKISESKPLAMKRDSVKSNDSSSKATDLTEIPKKKKIEEEKRNTEVIVIEDTPRKKTSIKEKITPTVTKRKKATNVPLPNINETGTVASSDDEDVRYMFNPDFKEKDTAKEKFFLKVTNMRDSLSLKTPNSKNIVRRTYFQRTPKMSRPKPKPVESTVSLTANTASALPKNTKPSKVESIPSTDSDDSDVKYSFPKTAFDYVPSPEIAEVTKMPKMKRNSLEVKRKSLSGIAKRKSVGSFPKTAFDHVPSPEIAEVTKMPKMKRNSLEVKRKSLSGIAKKKSMGRPILSKLKEKAKPAPGDLKIKRRQEVDYRCDCGQLFHSAALLVRHTTLAHTPPRIRRRRSPLPENSTKPLKLARKNTISSVKHTAVDSRKSSVRSENKANVQTPGRKRKASADVKSAAPKPRRTPAHKGVPVPEKMKKLAEEIRQKKHKFV